VNLDQILDRIADVTLRNQIKRQIEIQNETIQNLESLVESQSRKIKQLGSEIVDVKNEKQSKLDEHITKHHLFESDNIFWSISEKNGVSIYRAHCPQCQQPLKKTVDFWECKSCGFTDIGVTSKPSKIPEWAS